MTKKTLRILLIALSAIMVFSLFSCGGSPEEKDTSTEENETPVESSNETPADSESESSENQESSEKTTASDDTEDTQGGVTPETSADETETTADEIETTAAETESDPAETTTETETTEIEYNPDPDCEHAECTEHAAKDATCTAAGNPAYKVCKACGAIIGEDGAILNTAPTIAAKGHNPGAPDKNDHCNVKCTECFEVLKENKHTAGAPDPKNGCNVSCSACGEVLAASKHTPGTPDPEDSCNVKCTACNTVLQKNKHAEYKETSTLKDNVRTYTNACTNCGDVKYTYDVKFNANMPEVFLPASTLQIHCDRTSADKFESYDLSADGSYISVVGKNDNETGDASFMLYAPNPANLPVTGQYLLIKYRTTCNRDWEIFASAGNGHTGAIAGDSFYVEYRPSAADNGCFVADGEWRYMIVDLAAVLGDKFKAETAGENAGKYVCSYIRFDIMNDKTTEARQVDIAYAALADNLGDLVGMDGMEKYTFVNFAWSSTADKYGIAYSTVTGNQIFDANYLNSSSNIKDENANNKVSMVLNKDAENNNLPYVTLTYNGDEAKEEIVTTLWSSNTNYVTNAGNYIVILYRAKRPVAFQFYLNSEQALDPSSHASFSGSRVGGWSFAVIDISGAAKYDSATGLKYARFDFLNDLGGGNKYNKGDSVDFGFVALCDDANEATALMQYYIASYLSETYECAHTDIVWDGGYTLDVIDDKAVHVSKNVCTLCGLNAVDDAATITLIGAGNVKNSEQGFNSAAIPVTNKAAKSNGTAINLNLNGDLTIAGWGGVEGATLGIAYKVLDADGKELMGWTPVTGTVETADSKIQEDGGVQRVGCDPAVSYNVTADLSSLIGAESQTVQVVFAFISANGTEINDGNNAYADFLTFTNVTLPAKAQ